MRKVSLLQTNISKNNVLSTWNPALFSKKKNDVGLIVKSGQQIENNAKKIYKYVKYTKPLS